MSNRKELVGGSTGLQHLRNRYYDMETGRFISREPLSAMPGWVEHPYMYASANPVRVVYILHKMGEEMLLGLVVAGVINILVVGFIRLRANRLDGDKKKKLPANRGW